MGGAFVTGGSALQTGDGLTEFLDGHFGVLPFLVEVVLGQEVLSFFMLLGGLSLFLDLLSVL